MRKERIFVGSASEGKKYAKKAIDFITSIPDINKKYEFTPWWDFYVPGETTYDQIIHKAPTYDFAIFICTPDDQCYRIRDIDKNDSGFKTTRDNVFYEMGYFSGVLSSKRVVLLVEDGCELASDHEGLTTIRFEKSTFDEKCVELLQYIDNESNTTRISLLPSTSLAVSFCNSFLRNIIQGINKEDQSLRAYFKGCRSGKKFEKIQVNIISPHTLSIELNAWIDYHTQHLELTEKICVIQNIKS